MGAIVAELRVALHDYTLRDRAESRVEHYSIGVEAREIHAGDDRSDLARTSEFAARIEQAAKFPRCVWPAAHRSKFDIAFSAARFRSGPDMANGKSGKLSTAPGQH